MAPSVASSDEGFEATLDHRDHGFDLHTIAVGGEIKSRLHEPPIVTAGRFGGGPAVLGRDDRADTAFQTSERMVGLRVEAGVGRNPADPHAGERCGDERPKVGHIGLRSAALLGSEYEMRLHITDHTQFGKAMINDGFPRAADVSSPAHEVAAGGTRLQAGRVDRRATNASLAAHVFLDRGVEQASGRRSGEQTPRRLLQRRVVRNRVELQGLQQRRAIRQMSDHAPIVGLQETLEDQTSKELMLRKLFRAVAMRVRRQRPFGSGQRCQQHCPRRFTRCRHAFTTNAGINKV